MKDMVNLIAKRYAAHEILVEDKGSGTQYIQTQSGRDGRRRKAPAPVTPILPGPNDTKAFRFDAVIPLITSGEVLFPEKAEWIPDYESELSKFPDGKFDDQVDSTSQYLNHIGIKVHRGSQKVSRNKPKPQLPEHLREQDKEHVTNYIGTPPPNMGHNGGPPLDP